MSDSASLSANAARRKVTDYLLRLGLRDEELIQGIADYCVYRARRRVGRSGHEELPRRAIEEVMRRMDKTIAHAFGVVGADAQHLARFQVAMELGCVAFPVEPLLRGGEIPLEARDVLLSALPQATPAESHRPLVEQRFEFFCIS